MNAVKEKMVQVGSQMRQNLQDSEYVLAGRIDENQVILRDGVTFEVYAKNDHSASHVIVINNEGYEFVRTALIGDLWWAGLMPTEKGNPHDDAKLFFAKED